MISALACTCRLGSRGAAPDRPCEGRCSGDQWRCCWRKSRTPSIMGLLHLVHEPRRTRLPRVAHGAKAAVVSDSHQTLAFPDVPPDRASTVVDSATQWLIREGIVAGERTECVLGADQGHPPGPQVGRAIIETPVAPEMEPHVLDFRDLSPNGMVSETGRAVHHGNELALEKFSMTCPSCRSHLADPDRWTDQLDTWYETGTATIECPLCGTGSAMTTWTVSNWSLSYAALTFWNWPDLDPRFIEELSQHLGERIELVVGRL